MESCPLLRAVSGHSGLANTKRGAQPERHVVMIISPSPVPVPILVEVLKSKPVKKAISKATKTIWKAIRPW